MKVFKQANNYFGIYDSSRRVTKLLHRYVWELYNGPIPEGMDIHHINGNPACNCICNLEMLTRREHKQRHRGHPGCQGYVPKSGPKVPRPVQCTETGVVYPSASQAARELDLHVQSIGRCLNGRQQTARGCHWKYA